MDIELLVTLDKLHIRSYTSGLLSSDSYIKNVSMEK